MVFKLLEHPIIASAEKLALILSEVNDALANVDSGFIRLIALEKNMFLLRSLLFKMTDAPDSLILVLI